MGGAEGKVAYIGEFTLRLHPARTHFLPQIQKVLSDQRGESHHSDIAGPTDTIRIAQIAERFGSKITRSKIMNSSWALTFVVDPEQAQENISYGRALNSEARLPSHPLLRDNYLPFKSINLSFSIPFQRNSLVTNIDSLSLIASWLAFVSTTLAEESLRTGSRS